MTRCGLGPALPTMDGPVPEADPLRISSHSEGSAALQPHLHGLRMSSEQAGAGGTLSFSWLCSGVAIGRSEASVSVPDDGLTREQTDKLAFIGPFPLPGRASVVRRTASEVDSLSLSLSPEGIFIIRGFGAGFGTSL